MAFANMGNREAAPEINRVSICTLPSRVQPNRCGSCTNAARRGWPCGLCCASQQIWHGNVRFSNRSVWVKRFQTIHGCGADVARGLVLLYGIDTKAVPSWDSKTRRTNLWGGFAIITGPSGHAILTSSIVPRGTSCHRAVEFGFSPIGFDLALSCGCSLLLGPAELGAVNPDAMHDHGQPARQRHDCPLIDQTLFWPIACELPTRFASLSRPISSLRSSHFLCRASRRRPRDRPRQL